MRSCGTNNVTHGPYTPVGHQKIQFDIQFDKHVAHIPRGYTSGK